MTKRSNNTIREQTNYIYTTAPCSGMLICVLLETKLSSQLDLWKSAAFHAIDWGSPFRHVQYRRYVDRPVQ
jgi:hypothetical protein